VSIIHQFLSASLIDELHLALRPVLLGTGEHLLIGLNLVSIGYECTRSVAGERATDVYLRRTEMR
jgi:dihydrofolate reductase